MTHFPLDLLNSPIRLWLRMVRVLKLLHLPSVLQQQLFLQLPLGAVRQNLNQLLAVGTIIVIVILLQLMLSFLWPHFVLQVLLLLDICFKISLSDVLITVITVITWKCLSTWNTCCVAYNYLQCNVNVVFDVNNLSCVMPE